MHIPPRVPVNDPGLPRSLNGRFNSTQQIQRANQAAPKANLSDIRVQTESAQQRTNVPPQNYRRRTGLQDRIAGIISRRNPTPNGQQPHVNQAAQSRSRNFVARQPRPAQPHIVPRRQPNVGQPDFAATPRPKEFQSQEVIDHVMNETILSFQADKYARAAQKPTDQDQQASQQMDALARQELNPKSAATPEEVYYTRRDERTSQFATPPVDEFQNKQPNFQAVEGEKDQFVNQVNLPGEPDYSEPPAVENRIARQQFQLPKSPSRTTNTKPVSVLSKPTQSRPQSESTSDSKPRVMLPSEKREIGRSEFEDNLEAIPASSGNRLRSQGSFQQEDSLDLDDDDDLLNRFDPDRLSVEEEGEFDQPNIERESNPLRKSCEEFSIGTSEQSHYRHHFGYQSTSETG